MAGVGFDGSFFFGVCHDSDVVIGAQCAELDEPAGKSFSLVQKDV